MKDVALIAVNLKEDNKACENAGTAIENSLNFLQKIDPVDQDTEEVIFGTFPVLVVGNYDEALEAYATEGMIFQLAEDVLASENEAGQSLAEVLELLDIRNAYVCGMSAEKEIRQLCGGLSQNHIRPHLLDKGIGYPSGMDYQAFLEDMKEKGVKVTEN